MNHKKDELAHYAALWKMMADVLGYELNDFKAIELAKNTLTNRRQQGGGN